MGIGIEYPQLANKCWQYPTWLLCQHSLAYKGNRLVQKDFRLIAVGALLTIGVLMLIERIAA